MPRPWTARRTRRRSSKASARALIGQIMNDDTATGFGTQPLPLTPEEDRVLRYLPTDLTFRAIARELSVSHNTVKTHTVLIYRKLGVSCRHDAVTEARRNGLLESRPSDIRSL
jgi:LuxR family maltose regulon positive regulatory protein